MLASSVMLKGGVREGLSTLTDSASTSISPVGRFLFSVPAGLGLTTPVISMTYSDRHSAATLWAA